MSGRKKIDTKIPELLVEVPICLRAAEAVEKWRFTGHGIDDIGPFILIIGKGYTQPEEARPIHVPPQDYKEIVEYYEDRKHQIHYRTLYRRKLHLAKTMPGNKNKSVTHRSRYDAYETLGPNATVRELKAVREELRHSRQTADKNYDRILTNQAKKKRLAQL